VFQRQSPPALAKRNTAIHDGLGANRTKLIVKGDQLRVSQL